MLEVTKMLHLFPWKKEEQPEIWALDSIPHQLYTGHWTEATSTSAHSVQVSLGWCPGAPQFSLMPLSRCSLSSIFGGREKGQNTFLTFGFAAGFPNTAIFHCMLHLLAPL